VPLSDVTGGIVCLLHTLSHGNNVEWKRHRGLWIDYPLEGPPVTGDVSGYPDTGLILSALHGATGWGTDSSGGIEVGKAHPVLGQLIDVGGIDEIVSVAANVSPSQIVDEDKHDVGLLLFFRFRKNHQWQKKKGDQGYCGFHLVVLK
jgi:hypothetical protein